MSKILGLDLGTNSIGWAIIDNVNNRIINSGVRIFPEGVNRTTSGSEVSKNEDRRNARSIRKQNFRFKRRRDELISKLKKYRLFPNNDSDFDIYFQKNPYTLRKKGLDERLTLSELGRILYHLNERRGFKTNRKIDNKQESKIYTGKDDTAGITDTQKAIEKGNYRTLGEYLAAINPVTERIRNRYTLRKMYQDEFDIIWKKQQKFYPDILTDEVKDDIYDTIFFQRKLKSQKHAVGYCVLEPKKRCTPKSSPIFQYFRILEQVSRIKITTEDRINEPLNDEERFTLIKYLEEAKERNFKQIKKKLGLPEDCHINLEQQEKLLGAKTNYDLRKVFGKTDWEKRTPEKRQEIWHTLHFSDDSDWLADYASEKWGLDNDQIDKLLKIKLESGYARLSQKAIMNLIPFLEQGMTYDKAAKEAGYHHSLINRNKTLRDFLPEPENLRNPIVQQTLYELRRVVNEIIRQYGKPDIFRVELLRDLKLSKKRRREITLENLNKKRKNEEIRKILTKEFGFSPSREDIQKYILWEECHKICPYTGKSISLAALYNGDFEIEHIIPYSRCLDNSMRNKTLCYKSVNLEKGKKTPFEAFSGDRERWEAMCKRMYKNIRHKYSRFITEDAAVEIDSDFFEKQLRDSAYIAREVYNYLKTISKKVEVTKGMATSQLRHLWGLNDILSDNHDLKNRGDHRHHAIDAMVIANTNIATLHKLSSYHKYEREVQNQTFPNPWQDFRKDAETAVNSILVSHKVNKRVRGKLHEDTFYGKIHLPDGTESFVVRKPITALTPKNVLNIVDPMVRKTVLKRLHKMGVDTNGKFTIPKDAFTEPLYMPGKKARIKSTRVKIPASNMIKLYNDRELYVEPGKNNHIEIFINPESGQKTGRVISLFEASQRLLNHQPIVDRTPPEDGYQFLMSLSTNELVLVDINSDTIDWQNPNQHELGKHLYRVQKISVNRQITFRHHLVSGVKDDTGVLRKNPSALNAIKVRIDALGNIREHHD